MDCQTYILKCTDVLYKSVKDEDCFEQTIYDKILQTVTDTIENENMEKMPYYYISLLNSIHELDLEDYVDDESHENLKSLSKQLTLYQLKYIISDLFNSNYHEKNLKIHNTHVRKATDIIQNNISYESIYNKETRDIICLIRNLVYEYVKNIDNFDYDAFDRELTDNLYDTINCYDMDDEDDYITEDEDSDEDYIPDESDEDDDESDEDDDDIHELLDIKIEEIRKLKQEIEKLKRNIRELEDDKKIFKNLIQDTSYNEENYFRSWFQLGVITCVALIFLPLTKRDIAPIFEIDYNL